MCCCPWGCEESDTTEQLNGTELIDVLRKEIKEVKDKKISHVLALEDNIVKMSILLKGMYGFSPYQNPKGIFLTEIEETTPQFMWRHRKLQSQINPDKE